MIILAIDYGEKKVGVAISDETEFVTKVLDTLFVKNDQDTIAQLKPIISQYKVGKILLGIPSGWKNIDSPQTTIVRNFKVLLGNTFKLPIVEWDESYSSKIVEKKLTGKQKKQADSYAAAHILQEFLDYQHYEKNLN